MFRAIQIDISEEKKETNYRPLRCFQDVKTRWDSTNRMLMRSKKLRPAIDRYSESQCPHLALSESEWQQVDYVITILRPFAVFTQLIGTTRDPTIHRVYGVYSILLDHLDKCEKKLKRKRKQWKVLLFEGLQAARAKLFDFYEKTETSDAGKLFGMAILLNPAAKDSFWKASHWQEDSYWVQAYWVELEALYDLTYRSRTLTTKRMVAPREMRRHQEPNLDDVMIRIHSDQASDRPDTDLTDAEVELMDYRQFGKFMVASMVVIAC